MCGAPKVPDPVQRQDVRLPEGPDLKKMDQAGRNRKMAIAGLVTSPTGALGSASVGKATLG